MSQQSPIFVRTEVFMKWLLEHTSKFPKHERFRLAKFLDDALIEFHHQLLCAVKLDKKRYHLQLADIELERIRAYLRLAAELTYTKPEQLKFAFEHTQELGNLLGAWLKNQA
jgi:hypothetical protein